MQTLPSRGTSAGRASRAVLRGVTLTAVSLATWSGCKPDVGTPPSLVTGPRLLAVRETSPEVMPGVAATFEALVADVDGTVPMPVAWTLCRTPRPPAESNSVSQACVTQPDDDIPAAGPVSLTMPSDACSLFGPDPPPVTPPIRPRDPDTTGGFYVPVRAAAVAGDGTQLLAFALERVRCNLANAPGDVVRAYNMTYVANTAPALGDIVLDPDGPAAASVLAAPQQPPTVSSATKVTVRVLWPAEAAESYPLYDSTTRTLTTAREGLRVSWFATDGAFEHDRTGRTGDEPDVFTDNTWTAPTVAGATSIHFWVVLRDERGGLDFAAFDLMAAP